MIVRSSGVLHHAHQLVSVRQDEMKQALIRSWRSQLSACSRGARFRFVSTSSGSPSLQVFNDKIKWLQRERSAVNAKSSREVDYLRDEVAIRLCERLLVRELLRGHPLRP